MNTVNSHTIKIGECILDHSLQFCLCKQNGFLYCHKQIATLFRLICFNEFDIIVSFNLIIF